MTTGCEIPSSYDERVKLIHEWQRLYGMEPRKDSKLTEMFASGKLNMFPDQVARELMATDFIYKYTLYGELIEEFMRKVASRLKKQYNLTWTATWEIVRFYAPIGLKLTCLLQTQRVIPQHMPTSQEDDEAVIFSPSSAPDEPTYPIIPSTLSSMNLEDSSPSLPPPD